MPQIDVSDETLCAAMSDTARSFVIIVVDENDEKDHDKRKTKVNAAQVDVLNKASEVGVPVFLMTQGGSAQVGTFKAGSSTYSSALNAHIPDGATTFGKMGSSEPPDDFWVAVKQVKPVPTDVVVMGQSTNACVKDTAKGAVDSGLNVHTHADLLRDAGGMGKSAIDTSWGLPFIGVGTYSVYESLL